MIQAPNTTPYPNEILDEIMRDLNGAEFKALSLVVRQTFGWHREWSGGRFTSISAVMEGCGLSRPTAIAATASLVGRGLIERRDTASGAEYRVVVKEVDREAVKKVDPLQSNNLTGPVKKVDPLSIYKKKQERKKEKGAGADAPAAIDGPWVSFYVELLRRRNKLGEGEAWDGKVPAWVGQTARAFGRAVGPRNPAAAQALMERWFMDPETRKAQAGGFLTDRNCATRAGDWLAAKAVRPAETRGPDGLTIGSLVRYNGLTFIIAQELTPQQAETVARAGQENGGHGDLAGLRRWQAEMQALIGSGAIIVSDAA